MKATRLHLHKIFSLKSSLRLLFSLLTSLLVVGSVLASYLTYVERYKDGEGGIDGLNGAIGVTTSPDGKHVYTTGSSDDAVAVFSRNASNGKLTFIEVIKDSWAGIDGLNGAIELDISPDGKHVYITGSVDDALAVFARDVDTGKLTFIEVQQDGVDGVNGLDGAYGVAVSPDGEHVYVTGRIDKALVVFRRNTDTGRLTFIEVHQQGVNGLDALSGAVGLVISSDGNHIYTAANQNDAVALFSRNIADGKLTFIEIQKDSVNGVDGLDGVQDVTISPDGKHVYAAGSVDDALAVFSRNESDGKLTFIEVHIDSVNGLDETWSLAVRPDGKYVYATSSRDDQLTVFSRNTSNGKLTHIETHKDGLNGVGGLDIAWGVTSSPDCKHVYVAGYWDDALALFSVPEECTDLEATKVNDTAGIGTVGVPFNWTVTISNTGLADATFTDGQVIFMDNLPPGPAYDAPAVQSVTDVTNSVNIVCGITSDVLTCAVNGAAVTIGAATGEFNITFQVTPNAAGDLANPAGNGACQVDPDENVSDIDETNNNCTDEVKVEPAAVAVGDDANNGRRFILDDTRGVFRFGPVIVTVPAGALSGESGCRLVIKEAENGNFNLGNRVYDVSITCNGVYKTSFNPPLEVCIKPTNAQLQAAGWTFANLTLFHNHAGQGFNPLFNSYEKSGYLCAEISKLSLFAIGVAQLPDTGFAPGVVTQLQAQPAEKEYFDLAGDGHFVSGAPLGSASQSDRHLDSAFTLEIPALDVEMTIVGVPLTGQGWDVSWLGEAAGYLEGTAYPTWAGNTALTAHVWDANNNPGPFVNLHTLKHGDEIIIHAWGQNYVYEVRALTEVSPSDLRALPHSDYDVLTLITCKGYNPSSQNYDGRLAVQAVLVDVK